MTSAQDTDRLVHDARTTLDGASNGPASHLHPDTKTGRAVDFVNTAGDAASDNKALSLLVDGINSLLDSLPGLVKALEEISKIHPYVGSEYRISLLRWIAILIRTWRAPSRCWRLQSGNRARGQAERK